MRRYVRELIRTSVSVWKILLLRRQMLTRLIWYLRRAWSRSRGTLLTYCLMRQISLMFLRGRVISSLRLRVPFPTWGIYMVRFVRVY